MMEFSSSLIRQGMCSGVHVVYLKLQQALHKHHLIRLPGELRHQYRRIVREFPSSLIRQGMRDAVHVVYLKLEQALQKHGFAGPTVQHWPHVTIGYMTITSILTFLLLRSQSARKCVSPHRLLVENVWNEPLTPNLCHEDVAHLVFDVGSLLWNGVRLEGRCGWKKFACIALVLWFLSTWLELMAAVAPAVLLGIYDRVHLCLGSFSGLAFALKVLVNHRATSNADFFDIAVSAEMVVARALLPNPAYFVTYFCGILAGFCYVYAANSFSEAFPSSDTVRRLAELPMDIGVESDEESDETEEEGDETGRRNRSHWLCRHCSYRENNLSSLVCEMCSTPPPSSSPCG